MAMLNLHVGYAKTGTTFLQEHIFPKLVGRDYLGRHYLDGLPCGGDEIEWVYQLAFAAHWRAPRELPGALNGKFVSSEAFIRPFHTHRTLRRLRALAEECGGIRLVISIRNQVDLILSRYVHDRAIPMFGRYRMRDALDFEGVTQCGWPRCVGRDVQDEACECKRNRKLKTINLRHYDYLGLYTQCASLFGRENVHMVVSERLGTDIEGEVRRLAHFLRVEPMENAQLDRVKGTRSNSARDRESYKAARREYFSESLAHDVFEFFKEGNQILDRELKLGFGGLGYFDDEDGRLSHVEA